MFPAIVVRVVLYSFTDIRICCVSCTLFRAAGTEVPLKLRPDTTHVYNPYHDFQAAHQHSGQRRFAWPRGFPLDAIRDFRTTGSFESMQRERLLPCAGPSRAVPQLMSARDSFLLFPLLSGARPARQECSTHPSPCP
jgi:hypothetical protein